MGEGSSLSTLSVVWFCINFIVIVPLCSYLIYVFWTNKSANVIHLRKPMLVMISNCYMLYFLAIHGPTYLVIIDLNRSMPWHLASFIFDSVGYEIGFTLYLLRAWHVYYDINYNHIKARHVWSKILNRNSVQESSRFIKVRNTLGNFKVTLKIAAAYIVFYIIGICCITYGAGFDYGEMFSMITLLIILIPFAYIFSQIGSHYDMIGVRSELLMGCVVLFIADIIDVLLILLYNQGEMTSHNELHIILVLDYLVPSIAFFCVIMISTLHVFGQGYLPTKLLIPSFCDKKEGAPQMLHNGSSPVSAENDNKNDDFKWNNDGKTFDGSMDVTSMIATKEGFHMFMDYLVKEYAFENLLFVIEVTQFKANAVSKMVNSKERMQIEGTVLELPENMPIGDTIAGDKSIQSQFIALYDKYVDSGKSTWEVNISSGARKRLVRLYKKLTIDDFCIVDEKSDDKADGNESNESPKSEIAIDTRSRKKSHFIEGTDTQDVTKQVTLFQVIKVFDAALFDVIKCLKDSFSRFNTTPEFEHWSTKRSPKQSVAIEEEQS